MEHKCRFAKWMPVPSSNKENPFGYDLTCLECGAIISRSPIPVSFEIIDLYDLFKRMETEVNINIG